METRTLGRTGMQVGVIGLGTEHLTPDPDNIDRVLAQAAETGANYVDLLYIEPDYWDRFASVYRPYHDRLVMAVHWGDPQSDIAHSQRTFDDVLERACDGYADIAMMTMIDDQARWDGWGRQSIELLEAYRRQGRIGAIGMSGHMPELAQQAVESGLIDVLMFGINMLSHDDPRHQRLIAACQAHDVGLVAMKPYWGGPLLVLDGQPTGITPSQCLSYVFDQPVATAVPGVKNPAELTAALHYLEAGPAERDYRAALAGLRQTLRGHCTYCRHCMPCPQGLDIAQTILCVDWAAGGVNDGLRQAYAALPNPASACNACGICLERCPFAVEVIDKMQQAVALYEAG